MYDYSNDYFLEIVDDMSTTIKNSKIKELREQLDGKVLRVVTLEVTFA